ncbi:hypothetical protein ACJX0J_012800, partial [Zea mays]
QVDKLAFVYLHLHLLIGTQQLKKNHVKRVIVKMMTLPQEEIIPRSNEAVGIQIKIHHTTFCATELICEVCDSKEHANLLPVIGIGQNVEIYYMKLAAAESQIVVKEIHAVTNLSQEVVMEEIAQEDEEDMEDDFISNEAFLKFDVAKIASIQGNKRRSDKNC